MYHCSTRWAHFLLGLPINPRRLVRFFGEGLQPRQNNMAARHVLPRSVFAVYPTIEENISSGELPTTEGNTRFYIRGERPARPAVACRLLRPERCTGAFTESDILLTITMPSGIFGMLGHGAA